MDVNLKEEWSRNVLGPFGQHEDKKVPYNIHIYPNLLDNDAVAKLRDDINSSIKLRPKDNDLYKFKQSKDLITEIPAKKLTPTIHEFIDCMLGKVRQHLENKTGKTLSVKNFDITASRYDVGDYLLCHNDNIKDNLKGHGRTLAFIYYLNSRPWTRDDGGALILFDSDSAGEPISINNCISPKPNTLIVFDTTSTSWHSVEEVYCKDDFRLSINGWFNTDKLSKVADPDPSMIEPCPYDFLKPINTDEKLEKFFTEYFNQEYLMEKTCLVIRRRFQKKSEINLTNFLAKDKFKEISDALREAVEKDENLDHIGPYNKRNYRAIKLERLPPVCKNLYDAFRSELFFMLLARLTGLDLQPPSIKHVDNKDNNEDTDEDSEDDDDEEEDDSDDGNLVDSDSSDEDDEGEEEEEDDDDDDDDGEEEAEARDEMEAELASENGGCLETNTASSCEGSTTDQLVEKNVDSGRDEQKVSVDDQAKRKTDEATTSKEKESNLITTKSPRKRKRTSDPLARLEFRHLSQGSYTLIHDHGFEMGEKSALDVILHFNHDFAVNFADGGYISYLDAGPDDDLHDMDSELLTVEPKSNCLSLVYRCDEGTCRFLKYISKAHKSNYQDLYCVFYERPDDLPITNDSKQS